MYLWKRRLLRVYKTLQAVAAQLAYGFPGRKLRVVGVTGTDGKTTTVYLIVRVLESAGYTVGAVSTIHCQVGTRVSPNTSKLTTPGPWALNALLSHMARAGCHYAVIECSSHRLDQGGLWGIPFDVAVVTNVTREHFDYHRDFADYTRAKRKLFQALQHPAKRLKFRRGVDPGGRVPTVAVANLDDQRAAEILSQARAEQVFGFSLRDAERAVASEAERKIVRVSARPVGVSDVLYCVRAGEEEALMALKLPGRFNLANALASVAVGVSQGVPLARVTRELSVVERIPGRMDNVERGQPFTIIIDYAVTPAAFEALYAEIHRLRETRSHVHTPKPQLIHVFGAAGERDRGKRPLLGEIAGRHADLVILTDEDPYGEDPERILDDLESGLKKHASEVRRTPFGSAQPRYLRIRDRRLAIREALKRARTDDIVLVTGKGAEETMAVGRRRTPWNDRRVIEEELGRRVG